MVRRVLRQLTPPLIWQAAAKLMHTAPQGGRSDWEHGVEQPAEFYDQAFEENDHWRAHYTESRYYPLWTVVADRVRCAGMRRVLDIGCGPGQVASLLHDKGVPAYLGLDFSPARIEQARAVCPAYRFEAADVFETPLLAEWEYDGVLIMEFLEHIERDLAVLQRIRPETRVLATVPNFPSRGHVRHFESIEAVRDRYRDHFATLDVVEHLANTEGKRYYLLEGVV